MLESRGGCCQPPPALAPQATGRVLERDPPGGRATARGQCSKPTLGQLDSHDRVELRQRMQLTHGYAADHALVRDQGHFETRIL